jgi:hypothetical protein
VKDGLAAALVFVVGAALFVLLCIGAYQGYWYLAKKNTQNQYDVNTGTQQYQAGLISQERDLVIGWNRSPDTGQKAAMADQFCAIYSQVHPVPADLAVAHSTMCP